MTPNRTILYLIVIFLSVANCQQFRSKSIDSKSFDQSDWIPMVKPCVKCHDLETSETQISEKSTRFLNQPKSFHAPIYNLENKNIRSRQIQPSVNFFPQQSFSSFPQSSFQQAHFPTRLQMIIPPQQPVALPLVQQMKPQTPQFSFKFNGVSTHETFPSQYLYQNYQPEYPQQPQEDFNLLQHYLNSGHSGHNIFGQNGFVDVHIVKDNKLTDIIVKENQTNQEVSSTQAPIQSSTKASYESSTVQNFPVLSSKSPFTVSSTKQPFSASPSKQPLYPTLSPPLSELNQNDNVQLVYIPLETLNKNNAEYKEALSKNNGDFKEQLATEKISNENFFKNDLQKPNFDSKPFQFATQKPFFQSNQDNNVSPAPQKKKTKLKPHQPPLALFMDGVGKPEVQVNDLVRALSTSNDLKVLDQVSNEMPLVFVGPANMKPPKGYAKFELPYLSNIDGKRLQRKVEELPFFVAPLSYRPPNGFSKIPFPEPHVGAVVYKEMLKTPFDNNFNNNNLFGTNNFAQNNQFLYHNLQNTRNSQQFQSKFPTTSAPFDINSGLADSFIESPLQYQQNENLGPYQEQIYSQNISPENRFTTVKQPEIQQVSTEKSATDKNTFQNFVSSTPFYETVQDQKSNDQKNNLNQFSQQNGVKEQNQLYFNVEPHNQFPQFTFIQHAGPVNAIKELIQEGNSFKQNENSNIQTSYFSGNNKIEKNQNSIPKTNQNIYDLNQQIKNDQNKFQNQNQKTELKQSSESAQISPEDLLYNSLSGQNYLMKNQLLLNSGEQSTSKTQPPNFQKITPTESNQLVKEFYDPKKKIEQVYFEYSQTPKPISSTSPVPISSTEQNKENFVQFTNFNPNDYSQGIQYFTPFINNDFIYQVPQINQPEKPIETNKPNTILSTKDYQTIHRFSTPQTPTEQQNLNDKEINKINAPSTVSEKNNYDLPKDVLILNPDYYQNKPNQVLPLETKPNEAPQNAHNQYETTTIMPTRSRVASRKRRPNKQRTENENRQNLETLSSTTSYDKEIYQQKYYDSTTEEPKRSTKQRFKTRGRIDRKPSTSTSKPVEYNSRENYISSTPEYGDSSFSTLQASHFRQPSFETGFNLSPNYYDQFREIQEKANKENSIKSEQPKVSKFISSTSERNLKLNGRFTEPEIISEPIPGEDEYVRYKISGQDNIPETKEPVKKNQKPKTRGRNRFTSTTEKHSSSTQLLNDNEYYGLKQEYISNDQKPYYEKSTSRNLQVENTSEQELNSNFNEIYKQNNKDNRFNQQEDYENYNNNEEFLKNYKNIQTTEKMTTLPPLSSSSISTSQVTSISSSNPSSSTSKYHSSSSRTIENVSRKNLSNQRRLRKPSTTIKPEAKKNKPEYSPTIRKVNVNRGKLQFKTIEPEKGEISENENYPVPFLQKLKNDNKYTPKNKKTSDQISHSSNSKAQIETPDSSSESNNWNLQANQQNEEKNIFDKIIDEMTNFENLNETKKEKSKKRGFWKRIKVRPTDVLESAESQFVNSASPNELLSNTQKKTYFQQPTEDEYLVRFESVENEEINKTKITTEKPLVMTVLPVNYNSEDFEQMYFMTTPQNDIEKQTTPKYTKEIMEFGATSVNYSDLTTTHKPEAFQTTTTTSAPDILGSLLSIFSSEKNYNENLNNSQDKKERNEMNDRLENSRSMKEEVVSLASKNEKQNIESIDKNEETTTEPSEEITFEPTVTTEDIQYTTEETSQDEKPVLKLEEPNKNTKKIINSTHIISTSTTTEISHETEICYRGRCVRSNSTEIAKHNDR